MSQQDLWAALQQASSKPRPHPHPLSSFSNGISDITTEDTNKYDLLCPRVGCGSVILRKGVAKLKDRESVKVGTSQLLPVTPLDP